MTTSETDAEATLQGSYCDRLPECEQLGESRCVSELARWRCNSH